MEGRDDVAPSPAALPAELDLVLVNAPPEKADAIARALVEQRLVACVNVVPRVKSVYRWQGKVEEAEESTLLMKTRRSLVPALTTAVKLLHPYEVPEIIALPIATDRGNTDYLAWVVAETSRGD
ncbi:MAG: divalent-cation tolerance protein CutA [Polyangiaceae bacterium]